MSDITLQIKSEKFSTVDNDLPQIYLRLHAQFGPAGLRGLRATLGHTDRHASRQLCI